MLGPFLNILFRFNICVGNFIKKKLVMYKILADLRYIFMLSETGKLSAAFIDAINTR